MNALLVLLTLLAIILYLIYVISKRKFDYWKKKNVPYVEPTPLLGNYRRYIMLQEYPGHLVQKLCKKFPDAPYFGAYFGTEPVLIVQSPEILKHVFTKDFYYFSGREVTKYEDKEVVTQNLFFASGDKWKVIRHNLTPMFSSAKMKNMFYLIEKSNYLLEDMLEKEARTGVMEARDTCARYTMDNICSCAYGVEANTMTNPDKNPFKYIADQMFRTTNYSGFKMVFRAVWPKIFYNIGFKCFPSTIDGFFSQLLKGVFESRNYKPSLRQDFVDLVLTLKNHDLITSDSLTNAVTGLEEKIQVKVDDDLLVAQCALFFAAGFETSSTIMSFVLFEFSKNLEAQKRAAEEIDEYLRRHGNKLNYECINELPYLEACLYETIRKYPVIGNLTREVMDDVTLPDGLRLDKGVRIHIPVYGMHHNPAYFPEPESFRPERFLPENENITRYTFLPYGEGPRMCIGKRFSKMQVLSGLVSVLKTYRVELADGMPETIRLESRSFLIQPREQGINLKIFKREGWEQRKFIRT